MIISAHFFLYSCRKRTCRLGLHNHNCAFLDMERLKNAGSFLRSGESPGKRDAGLDYSVPGNGMTADEFRAATA